MGFEYVRNSSCRVNTKDGIVILDGCSFPKTGFPCLLDQQALDEERSPAVIGQE